MSEGLILDASILDRLYEWGGDELKQKMIELFLEHAPERMDGIRQGLDGGDMELAERSAHSLKSSAANLGAQAVRHLAARIEESLESGSRDVAMELFSELEARFGETLAALESVGRSKAR